MNTIKCGEFHDRIEVLGKPREGTTDFSGHVCVPVVTFIGFGVRKSQVQSLPLTVTSCVNLGKLSKHSETLKCNGNLIIQIIQNDICQGMSKEDFPEKVTSDLDKRIGVFQVEKGRRGISKRRSSRFKRS